MDALHRRVFGQGDWVEERTQAAGLQAFIAQEPGGSASARTVLRP